MTRLAAAILPALLALLPCTQIACGDDSSTPSGETPPPPATTGATTAAPTSDDTTTGGVVPCASSQACGADQACAADHALGDPAPDPVQSPELFTCHPGCIEPGTLLLWCLDDDACCDGAPCRPDGLCGALPVETDGTTTDGSSGTGSTTDGSTGTGSTTDGSSGTGSGSGSGASSSSGSSGSTTGV